jgi:hypothetical protein
VPVFGTNADKSEPQNIEYPMLKGGFARAAQALAPRVAQSSKIK